MTDPSTITQIFASGLFRDRTVLVSGGTSGIGLACARAFHELGATVIATGATAAECARATEDTARAYLTFKELDVRDGATVLRLVSDLPRLDVVVNAAGVIRRDREHDPEVFADVVATNLTGTMRVCAAAKEKLIASKGCIINIASMLTFQGGARVPAYSASKGGVGQLTKSLAGAWAMHGVRINAVAPGWIDTAFTDAVREDPERSRLILSRTPMGRWGAPQEIAAGVVFLASPAACFVTGAILPIDGGYLAT